MNGDYHKLAFFDSSSKTITDNQQTEQKEKQWNPDFFCHVSKTKQERKLTNWWK